MSEEDEDMNDASHCDLEAVDDPAAAALTQEFRRWSLEKPSSSPAALSAKKANAVTLKSVNTFYIYINSIDLRIDSLI